MFTAKIVILRCTYRKEHSRAKGKRNFLKFRTTGHLSVLNVGYPNTRDTYNSYLLHNSDGDYEAIFRPYVWNHMCYMFKKGESRLALVGGRAHNQCRRRNNCYMFHSERRFSQRELRPRHEPAQHGCAARPRAAGSSDALQERLQN